MSQPDCERCRDGLELNRLRDELAGCQEAGAKRMEIIRECAAEKTRLHDENEQFKRAVGELDEERQRLRDAIRAHAEEWAWSPDSGWRRRRGPVLDDEEVTGATT